MVSLLDDGFVALQSGEDGDTVDLELSQLAEEVVDVAVLSLHHQLREHAWKLLLF